MVIKLFNWGFAPNPTSFLRRKRGKKDWERIIKELMNHIIKITGTGLFSTCSGDFFGVKGAVFWLP